MSAMSVPAFAQTATPANGKVCTSSKECSSTEFRGNPRMERPGQDELNLRAKKMLFKGITLTEDQQKKLDEAFKATNDKMEKIREEQQEKTRAAQEEFDADLQKILSAEQLEQYKANKEKAQLLNRRISDPRVKGGFDGKRIEDRKAFKTEKGKAERSFKKIEKKVDKSAD